MKGKGWRSDWFLWYFCPIKSCKIAEKIPPKRGNGNLPCCCGNGERVNLIYAWKYVIFLQIYYILLSDVLLQKVKTYQPRNLWYILLKEVPRRFTLAWYQHQGINHSSICYSDCGTFFHDWRYVFFLACLLIG